MSESNFAITKQLVKKEEAEKEYVPLTFRRLVRQRKGLKEQKQRKRRERHAMNRLLHAPRGAKKDMKKHGVASKIQRGFDVAKRWREE